MRKLPARRGSLSLDELEAVYRSEGAQFERVAIAIVGDEQLGCDAVHNAFVLAVRERKSFRGDAPVEAWLWRILLNEARKQRARELRLVATDPRELDTAGSSMNGSADRARIRASIAALSERQRLVVFLRYYADLDYAMIAQALEVKPGTVAATLNAARQRLEAQLQEVHEWEL